MEIPAAWIESSYMPILTAQGAHLNYEVAGDGPPVLLIQGTGVAGSGWAPEVAGLSEDFQCLSFDNRGIGKSTIGKQALTIEQMAGDAIALNGRSGMGVGSCRRSLYGWVDCSTARARRS